MSDLFNEDFLEFLQALNKRDVEYMLVGGYAVILHGYSRTTGDMDVWVNRTKDNYNRLMMAFKDFGLPAFELTEEKFMDAEKNDVFTFGRPPTCIEILTNLKGVSFVEAHKLVQTFQEDDVLIRFIHFNSLIASKKAAGRYRDLDDIEKLTNGNSK
ncbi:hypothetical protein BH10BAC2_BH10BAC2_25560 [soil metagenome]